MADQKTECNCGIQIVWFYDRPTILACLKCERTADHHERNTCRVCGAPLVSFVPADPEEFATAEEWDPDAEDEDEDDRCVCAGCGETFDEDDLHDHDGESYCADCHDEDEEEE